MKFVKRIVIYLAGLFFVALGVAFSVNSNLGVSPVNSLPYVVSRFQGLFQGSGLPHRAYLRSIHCPMW